MYSYLRRAFMSGYIVCHKKRNNPRMNVQVCQKKCDLKDNCKAYLLYYKNGIKNKDNPLSNPGSPFIELGLS